MGKVHFAAYGGLISESQLLQLQRTIFIYFSSQAEQNITTTNRYKKYQMQRILKKK